MIWNFLVIAGFLTVLIFNRKLFAGYLSPVSVFQYFWSMQIIVCLVMFGNTIVWRYTGLIWILFVCIALCFFSFSRPKTKVKNNNPNATNRPYHINSKKSDIVLVVITSLGFLYALLLMWSHGFSIRNLFDLDALLEMNNAVAEQRYYGNSPLGIIDKILLVFVYASPMCGGYAFVFAIGKKGKILPLLTFLPEVVVLFTENTKATMIGCIIFFVSGWLAGSMARFGEIRRFKAKTILLIGAMSVLMFVVFWSTMMLRTGNWNQNAFTMVQNKMSSYIFGHIPAFDYWFDAHLFSTQYTLGLQTFIGVFDLLGVSDRIQGVYQDFYDGGTLSTNVYSYHRGIVDDFGAIGGVFFIILHIKLAMRAYWELAGRKITVVNQLILSSVYAFYLYFMVSVFSYNSFILAFVIFAGYLSFVRLKILSPPLL